MPPARLDRSVGNRRVSHRALTTGEVPAEAAGGKAHPCWRVIRTIIDSRIQGGAKPRLDLRLATTPRAPQCLYDDQLQLRPDRAIEPLLGARQKQLAELPAPERDCRAGDWVAIDAAHREDLLSFRSVRQGPAEA